VTAESDEDGKMKAGDTTTMTMTMTAKKGGVDDEGEEEVLYSWRIELVI
jgi:hypothetical protein